MTPQSNHSLPHPLLQATHRSQNDYTVYVPENLPRRCGGGDYGQRRRTDGRRRTDDNGRATTTDRWTADEDGRSTTDGWSTKDGRTTTGGRRWTYDDGRTTTDGRRATTDGRRTDDGRRPSDDGRRRRANDRNDGWTHLSGRVFLMNDVRTTTVVHGQRILFNRI